MLAFFSFDIPKRWDRQSFKLYLNQWPSDSTFSAPGSDRMHISVITSLEKTLKTDINKASAHSHWHTWLQWDSRY